MEGINDMMRLTKHVQAVARFEVHFASEEKAKDFAYELIELGYSPRKRDWRKPEKNAKASPDNAVLVAGSKDEVLKPEFRKKISKIASKFNGKDVDCSAWGFI